MLRVEPRWLVIGCYVTRLLAVMLRLSLVCGLMSGYHNLLQRATDLATDHWITFNGCSFALIECCLAITSQVFACDSKDMYCHVSKSRPDLI